MGVASFWQHTRINFQKESALAIEKTLFNPEILKTQYKRRDPMKGRFLQKILKKFEKVFSAQAKEAGKNS